MSRTILLPTTVLAVLVTAGCSSSAKVSGSGHAAGPTPAGQSTAPTSGGTAAGGGVQVEPGAGSNPACKLLTVDEVNAVLPMKVYAVSGLSAPGKYSETADICHWQVGDPNESDTKAVIVVLEHDIDLAAAKEELATNADSGVGDRTTGLGDDAIDYGGPIEVLKGTSWVRVDAEVGDLKVDDTASAALAPIAVGRI